MVFLLDTNIVSHAIRNPHGRVAGRILRAADAGQASISIVVAAELRFGAAKGGPRDLATRIDALFEQIDVVPLEPPIDQFYAELRTLLERQGKPIGANDLLIAAHALTLGATLVTDNEREFGRIESLKIENWLR